MKNVRESALWVSIRDGVAQLTSRPIYLLMMVVVPMLFCVGFINLLDSGLPKRTPVAVVDLDGTPESRHLAMNINSQMLTAVDYSVDSYEAAMDLVRQGKVFGFFQIPRNFAADAGASRPTAISFYCNMAYFVPGTMVYEAIMKSAVTAKGELVSNTASQVGITPVVINNLLQPVAPQTNGIGNPWTNYNIYLSNSFIPCLLQLIIMQITVFTLLISVKRGTSRRLLERARGSVVTAVAGRLIPQFVIFLIVGLGLFGIMYGFADFPMNGSFAGMILNLVLFIIASQSMGLFFACVLPNLRLALSAASLIGILSFSLAGFSYPVEDMNGALGIFAYVIPIRYYFLIYINTALNGYELYYVRYCYLALMLFTLPPVLLLPRLRRHWDNQVYIP